MQTDFRRVLTEWLWKYHRELLCFAAGLIIGLIA